MKTYLARLDAACARLNVLLAALVLSLALCYFLALTYQIATNLQFQSQSQSQYTLNPGLRLLTNPPIPQI